MFLSSLDHYEKLANKRSAKRKELKEALLALVTDARQYKKFNSECHCSKSMASHLSVEDKIVCSTCYGTMT